MNCFTKEEFERWSRSPSLARQGSFVQSPLNSSSSANEVIRSLDNAGQGEGANNGTGNLGEQSNKNEKENKARALMVQPSVDYGKLGE